MLDFCIALFSRPRISMNAYCAGIFREEPGIMLLSICLECTTRVMGDMYSCCVCRFNDRDQLLRNYTSILQQIPRWASGLRQTEVVAATARHPFFSDILARTYHEYTSQLGISHLSQDSQITVKRFYMHYLEYMAGQPIIRTGAFFCDNANTMQRKDIVMDGIRATFLKIHTDGLTAGGDDISPSDSVSNVGV